MTSTEPDESYLAEIDIQTFLSSLRNLQEINCVQTLSGRQEKFLVTGRNVDLLLKVRFEIFQSAMLSTFNFLVLFNILSSAIPETTCSKGKAPISQF